MKIWIGIGLGIALVTTESAGLAQAPQTPAAAASPTTTAPATAAAASPGLGATINAETGQVVPGTVAGQGVPAAAVLTNRALAGRPAVAIPPPRSNITPAQMQNINRLVLDLHGLELTTRDPAEQKRSLMETLNAAPAGDVRPAPALISRLASELATVLPTLNMTAPQRRQLAIDLNLALNSGNLSAVEAQRVVADARTLLQGSSVNNPQGVEGLFAGLTAIVNQLQGQGSGSQTTPAQTGTALRSAPPLASPDTTTQAGQGGSAQTGQGAGSSQTGSDPTSR